MARNLKTDWVIVATSGPTIDGRVIKKEWLEDMAATYKESLYSAKIWPDHERWFGSQGKVLEVKIEPATDESLKGEIHLMAILSPSDDLVYANRRGKYTHSSIEVLRNFRGTGKFYLGGMAATDEPASVGTSELNFSADKDKFWICGPEVSFSSAEDLTDEMGLLDKFKNLLNKDKGESRDTPMDKEQFNQFTTAQNKTVELLTSLIGKFDSLLSKKPGDDGKDKSPDNNGKGESETQFVSKKDYDELAEKFTALDKKFTELINTGVPGTQTEENTGETDSCI